MCGPGDRPYVEAFLAVEATEAGSCPDVFFEFRGPCVEGPEGYLAALAGTIRSVHLSTAAELEVYAQTSEARDLPSTLETFLAQFGADFESLGLVLMPSAVADADTFRDACTRLAALPFAELKVLVVDSHFLDDAWTAGTPGASSAYLTLEAERVPLEIAKTLAFGKDAGDGFRLALCRLTTALAEAHPAAAFEAHQSAVAIAGRERWPLLEAIAHASMAGGLVAQGSFGDAQTYYEKGFGALEGLSAEEAGKARVACAMGWGNALLFGGRALEAAERFRASALLDCGAGPEGGPDIAALYAFEGHRLAAEASRQARDTEGAWKDAQAALAVYADKDAETQKLLQRGALLHILRQLIEQGLEPDRVRRACARAGLVWESA